ncbi:MAG: FxDxF family PEP-CTERM protein [Sphingomonas bacterium]|nr:FxDxF family PEP-CTERM protein [Sphingomonas bacterium]
MHYSKRLLPLAFAAAALTAVASPAHAVETITISGPSGTFGNDQVTCAGGLATCAFTNTFNFLTPTGFNLANASITTAAAGTSNINFTSVLLNGLAFTLSPTGIFENGTLANVSLTAGANNTLIVNGQNFGDGAFSGTLVFAAQSAVPEPATWAMMLLGFGAVGFSVRRRRPTLMQVA